jgi:hypothetical protein
MFDAFDKYHLHLLKSTRSLCGRQCIFSMRHLVDDAGEFFCAGAWLGDVVKAKHEAGELKNWLPQHLRLKLSVINPNGAIFLLTLRRRRLDCDCGRSAA